MEEQISCLKGLRVLRLTYKHSWILIRLNFNCLIKGEKTLNVSVYHLNFLPDVYSTRKTYQKKKTKHKLCNEVGEVNVSILVSGIRRQSKNTVKNDEFIKNDRILCVNWSLVDLSNDFFILFSTKYRLHSPFIYLFFSFCFFICGWALMV